MEVFVVVVVEAAAVGEDEFPVVEASRAFFLDDSFVEYDTTTCACIIHTRTIFIPSPGQMAFASMSVFIALKLVSNSLGDAFG